MSISSKHLDNIVEINGAARKIHPEDVSVGDDVAVSERVFEYPSFCWCGSDSLVHPREQIVCIRYRGFGDFHVWSVITVCLPFVLAENENNDNRVFDLRLIQLFKLDAQFASEVRKRTAKRKKKKKKKKRK